MCDGTHSLIDSSLPDNHSNSFQVAIRVARQPSSIDVSGQMRILEYCNSGFRGAVEAAFGFIGESQLSIEGSRCEADRLSRRSRIASGPILCLPAYFEALGNVPHVSIHRQGE
jgi:hypothetical protein